MGKKNVERLNKKKDKGKKNMLRQHKKVLERKED
jgi:hypothetical protein